MTEAFDLMSNSILDNIVTTEDDPNKNLEDVWKSDISNIDINSFTLLPTFEDFYKMHQVEIDANTDNDTQSSQKPCSEILRHDCMWSGTCVDSTHPSKKKNFRFCSNEEESYEDSDFDLETELTLENNLPSAFQNFNSTMQYDPAGMFQEILHNATQFNRNYIPPVVPKVNVNQQPPQFPHLQQTYHNIPVMFHNLSLKTPAQVKFEPPINKLIKIEDIKCEPIKIEHFSAMPEQHNIQQLLIYNEPTTVPVVPQVKFETLSYYPQVRFEPMNMPVHHVKYEGMDMPMPHPSYIHCPNELDFNNNNQFMNCKMYSADTPSPMTRMRQKYLKKKSQDRRKMPKNSKVRERKVYSMMRGMASSGSDECPLEKRTMHNSMERERRIGLKKLFVELKEAIPTLEDKDRVPKVSILREAISFCQQLKNDEMLLDDLKKKHNKLMTKYQKLYKTVIGKY